MEANINRIRMLIPYLTVDEIRARMKLPEDEFFLAYMASKRLTNEI